MKNKLNRIITALFVAVCLVSLPVSVSAEDSRSPIYPADIQNGTYEIEVDSTSSMFKVIACTLTVEDNSMSAHMTLSGAGFGKLYLGRGEDAMNEDESEFYFFGEDEEGRHTFDIPVEALDKPVPCAGWSIRKEQWYDRDLTFRSDKLPAGAVTVKARNYDWMLYTAVVVAVLAAVGIKHKKKQTGEK